MSRLGSHADGDRHCSCPSCGATKTAASKVREWVDRKRLIGQLPADSATALDELVADLDRGGRS